MFGDIVDGVGRGGAGVREVRFLKTRRFQEVVGFRSTYNLTHVDGWRG